MDESMPSLGVLRTASFHPSQLSLLTTPSPFPFPSIQELAIVYILPEDMGRLRDDERLG